MTTITAFIKRHPLRSYFALTLALSWGAVLIVAGGSGGISATNEASEMQQLFLYPALLVGPSVAGVLLTGLVSGRAGLCELRSRLLRWRVAVGWYAVALLTAPLSVIAALLALSFTSRKFVPGIVTSDGKTALLLIGIFAGLMVGMCEELGWIGFAIPRLRLRDWEAIRTWASDLVAKLGLAVPA